MKKILILFFFIHQISTSIFSQEYWVQGDTIFTEVFKVIYSEEYEQPLQLWYRVHCFSGSESREGLDFFTVRGIKTSNNEDYKNNIWDKGHLAPAGSFNCDPDKIRETFSFLNCALQHQSLNRGPWRELENYERELARKYGDVRIHITVDFGDSSRRLPTGAMVPVGFWKTILFSNQKMIFYFPNIDVKGVNWRSFEIKS
jgi:DNA/RNA endonuclease G (NUC1)